MREQTIATSVEFKGIGLHTGELATVRILPAPAGKGIVFRRVDLDNFELRADVASVARVAYATTLMSRGVWISTVEHLLSALYGIGIDNAYIELDNFEVPIQYDINFPHPLIGKQSLEVQLTGTNYADLIAPARTFGFYHEVEKLQASGLVRGGSLENAIVLTETGMLNDTSLRFADEFVRHKMLDLLGDFALIGQPVLGRLVANRAGHALHTRFVAELLESKSHWVLHTVSEMSVSAAR